MLPGKPRLRVQSGLGADLQGHRWSDTLHPRATHLHGAPCLLHMSVSGCSPSFRTAGGRVQPAFLWDPKPHSGVTHLGSALKTVCTSQQLRPQLDSGVQAHRGQRGPGRVRTCGVVRCGAAGRGSEASGWRPKDKGPGGRQVAFPEPESRPGPPTPTPRRRVPGGNADLTSSGSAVSKASPPPDLMGESWGSRRNAGQRETALSASATGHGERRRAPPRSWCALPGAESAVAPHVSGEEPCDWLSEEDGQGRRLPWTWRSPQATSSSSQPVFPPLDRSSACQVKVRNPSASRGVVSALRPRDNVSGLLTQSSQRQDQNNTVEWRSTQSPLPSEDLPLQNRVY